MKSKSKVLFLLLPILLIGCSNNTANDKKNIEKNKEKNVYNENIDSEKKANDINLGKHDSVTEKIESMTLDEKIGQMIIAGFNGVEYNEEIDDLINLDRIGGLILFSRNIESKDSLAQLISNIKSQSRGIPLFVSIDEEGGRVSRLPEDIQKFPASAIIGENNDVNAAYANGKSIGETLKSFGINMDHAPVLDIFSNPNNTVIGDRAFGNNPDIVSSMGIETMKGLMDSKIIPTVKHFPGHGDTDVDSHYGLPIVYKTYDELADFEFIPFKKAIENDCDVIMVSHIILENIDSEKPASLSKEVIEGILRNKLNFNNVIMTDDMAMEAITNYLSIEEASMMSIEAGTDIILLGNAGEDVPETIAKIKEKVISGEISEERINESVRRILKLKEKYDIWEQDNGE